MEPRETVILLAEDDAMVRNLVRLMLSKEGYAVLTANDGEEALEICRHFKDPIHLLLTDLKIPRINGLELAKRVQKKRPEIKIMIMSGATVDTILNENTPDAFLPKPFMPSTLLRCVQLLLTSEFTGICYESDLIAAAEVSSR
jgi:two-component system, cell cycle sensor histidine kinase and response regulator CckA